MSDTPKITYCIPSKSNLRYLKSAIPSIRENASRPDHDIIVFVDQDKDGTVEWLESVKDQYNVKFILNDEDGLYGIGRAYDACIERAETDIVCVFHADMYLCQDADAGALKYLERGKVVCSTRIEPPLHPEGNEKIVRDFGMWPEEDVEDGFKKQELHDFVDELLKEDNPTTSGMFAPWYVYKEDIQSIGGHDPRMRSAREDSDLFNRFKLNGYELIQSWESYVYHLTCRAGQFEHGILTKDHAQKSPEWQQLMEESTREFIRKWGTYVRTDEYLEPHVPHKYNICFVIDDLVPYMGLYALEPWADQFMLQGTAEQEAIIRKYVEDIQPATVVNLDSKLHHKTNDSNEADIYVRFNARSLDNNAFAIIQHLPDIIADSGEVGKFALGPFQIDIRRLNTYEHTLINVWDTLSEVEK